MSKCTSCSLAVAMVALLLLPAVSNALTTDQQALAGLKRINVLVEGLGPEAGRKGLTKDQIKTDVELQLRKAGIKVVTLEECLNIPGKPFLYVNINIQIDQPSGICGYSIHVELKELVTTVRGQIVLGTIWDAGCVGIMGIFNAIEIRSRAGDKIDTFINDYLAANPR